MAEADGTDSGIDKNSPSYVLKKRLLRRAFDAALYGKGTCRHSPPEMIAEILKRQKKAREWAREDERALETVKANEAKNMPRSVLAMNVLVERYAERLDTILEDAEVLFQGYPDETEINRLMSVIEDMLSYSRLYTQEIEQELRADLRDALIDKDREKFEDVMAKLSILKPVFKEAGWDYEDKPNELEKLRNQTSEVLELTEFSFEAKKEVLETLDKILEARYRDPEGAGTARLYTGEEIDEIRRRVESFLDTHTERMDEVFLPLAALPEGEEFIESVRSFIFEAGRYRLEAKKAVAKAISAYNPVANQPSRHVLTENVQAMVDQLFIRNEFYEEELNDALAEIRTLDDKKYQMLKDDLAAALGIVTAEREQLRMEQQALLGSQEYFDFDCDTVCDQLDQLLALLPQEELADAFDPSAAFRAVHEKDEFTGFDFHFAVLETRERATELLASGDYTPEDVQEIISQMNKFMYFSDLYTSQEQKLVSARIAALFDRGDCDKKAIRQAFDPDDAYYTLRAQPKSSPEGPTLH